uniref:Uncharacterized protein n=1 Tax=Candidatus Kentrum sp. FW TaxID=2126338 RepID=A0A450SEC4_9GAMM|nr:MAG: hypothetical protein BECKFW1821A_GA0114235_103010 [Candidatus Kentron sp. FW]
MKPFQFPLLNTDPRRLSPEEVDGFARRTGWIDDIAVISPETSLVEVQPLPWWEGVELIVARDPEWQARHGIENSAGAWLRDEHLHRLDGTSNPIHAMNAKTKPVFNDQNVLSYLGFFCHFVHAEDRPFVIVQSADDPIVPNNAPEKMLAWLPRPAQLLRQDERGYHCEALVWYADALFLSNFIVSESGMVEMIEDEELASELGASMQFNLKFR